MKIHLLRPLTDLKPCTTTYRNSQIYQLTIQTASAILHSYWESGKGGKERERERKLLLATRKIQICFNSVQLYSCVVPCHSKVISRHVKQVYITHFFSQLFPPTARTEATAAIKKYIFKRQKPRAGPIKLRVREDEGTRKSRKGGRQKESRQWLCNDTEDHQQHLHTMTE